MRGDQAFLQLGGGGAGRASGPGRLPMKQDTPPPPDPDGPYLTLYCILSSTLLSIPDASTARAWVIANKTAFDALKAGSPQRADRLRDIYRLHIDSLAPHAVAALPDAPAFTFDAAGLVDPGTQEGRDG